VARVIGEAGDRDARWLVGCVAERDCAGLARGLGDGCGTAERRYLLGVLASFDQGSDLRDECREADDGDAWQGFEQHCLGVSGEGAFEMELEIGDLGVEQADVGDGSAHDRFQYLRGIGFTLLADADLILDRLAHTVSGGGDGNVGGSKVDGHAGSPL